MKTLYPKVTYVSNITDIDDKIIAASQENKISIKELTEKYTKIYNEDMSVLGVNQPDIQPKATDYIKEMINLIVKLIEIDKKIQISILDNGIGIDNNKITKLFEPYFTTKEKGTGLGLSIVNKIINDHKGELEFNSIADGAKIEINFKLDGNRNSDSR